MVPPSSYETISAPMVMVASAPAMPKTPAPGALFRMMTPRAPASWAFLTLVVKLHVPRLMRAILPVTSAPLVRAEQPLAGALATTVPETSKPWEPNWANEVS